MLCPSSLQADHPMDTADWLKAIVQDGEASPMMMDSSSPSPSSADFLRQAPQAPPMLERRLRPPHDQPLKCPRCDSTHTKFCYYNNYSLSQPRYFCKTCRRYWTKGGSLRNVPVGGGCRKNKRSGGAKRAAAASAASADHHPLPLGQFPPPVGTFMDIAAGLGSTELQLSTLPSLLQPSPPPLSHLNPGARGLAGFMECKYGVPMGFDIAEAKFGGFLADPRGQFLLGVDSGGFGETGHGFAAAFGGGFQMDSELHGATEAENCQRLALPWNTGSGEGIGMAEAKPDPKMLSLEWQEQCGESTARGPFAYAAAVGGGAMWGGVVSGHGHHHVGTSAAPNQLI